MCQSTTDISIRQDNYVEFKLRCLLEINSCKLQRVFTPLNIIYAVFLAYVRVIYQGYKPRKHSCRGMNKSSYTSTSAKFVPLFPRSVNSLAMKQNRQPPFYTPVARVKINRSRNRSKEQPLKRFFCICIHFDLHTCTHVTNERICVSELWTFVCRFEFVVHTQVLACPLPKSKRET